MKTVMILSAIVVVSACKRDGFQPLPAQSRQPEYSAPQYGAPPPQRVYECGAIMSPIRCLNEDFR
jgi:hypothetical protein